MDDNELTSWLGDAADEVTDEQRDALHRTYELVVARYGGEDLDDFREAAFSAAAMIIFGDDTLPRIADDALRARIKAEQARAALDGAIIASADAGMSEVEIARKSGVSRPTVRKVLGK